MCVQEEKRIKVSQGGTVNYLKDNKKKNYNNSSSFKSSGKGPMQQSQNKQFPVDKTSVSTVRRRDIIRRIVPIS